MNHSRIKYCLLIITISLSHFSNAQTVFEKGFEIKCDTAKTVFERLVCATWTADSLYILTDSLRKELSTEQKKQDIEAYKNYRAKLATLYGPPENVKQLENTKKRIEIEKSRVNYLKSILALSNDIDDLELRKFENGVLSLCCNELLLYPFNGNSIEEIKAYCSNSTDSSYQEMINDSLHELILVSSAHSKFVLYICGDDEDCIEAGSYYREPSVVLPNGTYIGMSKHDFITKFFGNVFNSVIDNISKVSTCPDERGEWYINYLFENDTLKEINYSLDY